MKRKEKLGRFLVYFISRLTMIIINTYFMFEVNFIIKGSNVDENRKLILSFVILIISISLIMCISKIEQRILNLFEKK